MCGLSHGFAIMPCMREIDEISLPAALAALRASGFAPTVGDAPARWWTDEPRQAAWVQAAGGGGFAVVAVEILVPDRRPGMWQTANGRTDAGTVTGYRASFQTGGNGYGGAEFCSVFVDDVVATVRDWCDWERMWSVHPAVRQLVPDHQLAAQVQRLIVEQVDVRVEEAAQQRTASGVAHSVTVKGAASLQLVSGVALLRPDDVVFAAMLAGWRDQQAARNLSLSTIAARLRVIRAFVDYVNSYPWQWLAQIGRRVNGRYGTGARRWGYRSRYGCLDI